MPFPDAHSLLNKGAVCDRLGMSPRCLEMMVRDNLFPPPVRLGRYVYWSEAAMTAWRQQMFAEQEAWVVPADGIRRRVSGFEAQ